MHDADILYGNLQLIGNDLAQRRRDALADRVAAGVKDDLAGIVDFDPSILPWADAAGFDEAADADADSAAFELCRGAGSLEILIAEALQRALELAGQIAGVINHVMKWMLAEIVRHFFMADQVASSYVGGIELETMRDDIY